MTGKKWANSIKSKVEESIRTKLKKEPRQAIVDLINETGNLKEVSRILSDLSDIPINYHTFHGWLDEYHIAVRMVAK